MFNRSGKRIRPRSTLRSPNPNERKQAEYQYDNCWEWYSAMRLTNLTSFLYYYEQHNKKSQKMVGYEMGANLMLCRSVIR